MINFSLLGGFDPTNPPGVEVVSEKAKLLFNDTTPQYIYRTFRLSDSFVSDPSLVIQYAMASATSGNVVWACEVMAITPGDSAPVGTDSYDTANSVTDAVPGTAGYLKEATITLTNFDSAAPGDWVTLKIYRNASSGSDTATGDAGIVAFSLNFTSSTNSTDWITVQDTTISSPVPEIEFTFDDTSAVEWEFLFYDITPGTDNQDFGATFSIGNSPTYETSGYSSAYRIISTGTSNEVTDTTKINLIHLLGTATGENGNGTFTVFNPSGTGYTFAKSSFSERNQAGQFNHLVGGGHLAQEAAVTAVRFAFDSGNIASGRMVVRKFKPNALVNPATITSGSIAPTSTPAALGDAYVNTTKDEAYIATGTASSADWKKTTNHWQLVSDNTYASPGPDAVEVVFNDSDALLWKVQLFAAHPSGNDATPIHFRGEVSIGNSPEYETTGYRSSVYFSRSNLADYTGNSTICWILQNDAGNDPGEGMDGEIIIYNPQDSSQYTRAEWNLTEDARTNEVQNSFGVGSLITAAAATSMRIFFTNTNNFPGSPNPYPFNGRVLIYKWKP